MKNKKTKIGLLFASSLAFFAIGIATIGAHGIKENTEVSASSSEFTDATLPSSMTIQLKDNTDNEIKSYYAGLDGKSPSELSGTNLLKNLKSIISNNVTYYSYNTVSNIYAITDRDWTNSPASGIGGGGTLTTDSYGNPIITGYSHTSEIEARKTTDLYLHLLYCDYSVKSKTLYKGDGDVRSDQVSFDKEHVWSQSHGFDNGTTSGQNLTGAGSDLHHLKAGAQYGNRTLHSNYSYGFVDTVTISDSSKTYELDNKTGTPLISHSGDETQKVFEPQDCDKGDIARALLYLVACYNKYDGSTATPANPHLQLVDYTISENTTGYSSESESNGYYGALRDILAWHHMDPVDQYEIHRNNLIFNNYQHNRNPFIDYPEWVDYIWGVSEYNSSSKTISYNPTPTGSVDLNQDIINGYRTKTLQGISVTTLPTKTSYYKNDTLNTAGIVVTGTYDDGSTGDVTSGCTFSPTTLSTAGTQQITVTHSSGLTTSFNVTVSNTTRTLSSIAVTTMPTKTTYTQGDSFDPTGIVVTGTYNDSSTENVTNGCTYSPTTLNTVGTQQITVTHTSTNKQTTFNVTVNEPPSTETLTITRSSFSSVAGYGTIDAWTASTSETSTSISGYAELYTNSNYMQFNGANGNSLATGLFNTTSITGHISNITVNFNSSSTSNRSMDVYVGTSALFTYSSSTLTNNTSSGTKVGTANTSNSSNSFDVTGSNTYFALDKSSNALYIDSIVITIASNSSSSDSVSLNKVSTSLTVGGTETLVATASGSVTWTSSNTSVATVSNGEVTAVAEGTATITATCGTAHAECIVTVTNTSPTPVISADGQYFRKITSTDEVTSGKYVIAALHNNSYYPLTATFPSSLSTIASTTAITVSNNRISTSDASGYIVNITNTSGTVEIKNNASYLKSNVTASNNQTKLIGDASSSNLTQWTLSAGTLGTFRLVASAGTTRCLAYNWYNQTPTFGAYQHTNWNSTSTYSEIELFKEEQASAYAATFMNAFTCDNGAHEPSFKTGYSWSSLGVAFSNLDQADREELTGATANEIGTTVEQAVARYDKVVSHWKYENFMSRSITGLNNRTSFISSDNELFIVIIATSSIVSVTAIGLYMLLKKRKEQ